MASKLETRVLALEETEAKRQQRRAIDIDMSPEEATRRFRKAMAEVAAMPPDPRWQNLTAEQASRIHLACARHEMTEDEAFAAYAPGKR